ncbi:MAG: 1-(5-phosphoribosyl)-5-[(5-phosphoribosylamino)methylideneamino]imidazole-4-carboxamide isomerase [Thermotaleaceae bacterium]
MIVFPAIDIRNGKCVRLEQGEFDKESVFGEDPLMIAKKWYEKGAKYLHIVDLDGALQGEPVNLSIIEKIAKTIPIPIQVGGGIRKLEDVKKVLFCGVERIILGTSAINQVDFVEQVLNLYSENVAVSLDARNGLIAIEGWKKTTNQKALDYAVVLQNMGLKTLIYTDIAKDGMLSGPNFNELQQIQQKIKMNLIASGGISKQEDVKRLKTMDLYGAIIGKALYTGDIQLEEL